MAFRGGEKKKMSENDIKSEGEDNQEDEVNIDELDTEERRLQYKEESGKDAITQKGTYSKAYEDWLKALPQESESIIDKKGTYESYNNGGEIYIIVLGDDKEVCIYNDIYYAIERFDDILNEYPNARIAKIQYKPPPKVGEAGSFDAEGVAWENVYKLQREVRRKE